MMACGALLGARPQAGEWGCQGWFRAALCPLPTPRWACGEAGVTPAWGGAGGAMLAAPRRMLVLEKRNFPPGAAFPCTSPVRALAAAKPSQPHSPSPTRLLRLGFLSWIVGMLPKRLWREAKGAGKNLSNCGMQAQGWLLRDRWEALAWGFGAVSGGSLLGRAIAQPGQDLKERSYGSRKFLSHKTMSEHPQGWRLREEPSGQQPHSGCL